MLLKFYYAQVLLLLLKWPKMAYNILFGALTAQLHLQGELFEAFYQRCFHVCIEFKNVHRLA